MEAKKYFEEINNIADKIIDASSMDVSKMNEQEKQIMSAFCFGVINTYSLGNKVNAVQVQGAVIEFLINKLKYAPDVATQLCDFLIRCTEKDFHSSMYAIIHRGIDGYYQLEDLNILRNNISEIIKTVKKYTD